MPGLVATYREGDHSVRVVTPRPDVYLGPSDSLHPVLSHRATAEWSGFLTIVEAGPYTFDVDRTVATLFIRDRAVTDTPIHLDTGRHPIRILFAPTTGPTGPRLRWRSEPFPTEAVPDAAFSHLAGDVDLLAHERIERGRELVEDYGCIHCHRSSSPSLTGRLGPDLSAVGSRTTPSWVSQWLKDPRQFRAGAAMPAMLDAADGRDVAAYLATLGESADPHPVASSSAESIAEGRALYASIGCQACHDQPGLGLEGMGSKSTPLALAAYLKDPEAVDPSGRMPSLLLSDEEAAALAVYLVQSRAPAFERAFEGGDPNRGRTIVQTRGCTACHTLRDPEPIVNTLRAPPLNALRGELQGCLSRQTRADVPRYGLSDDERESILAFLQSYRQRPDIAEASVHTMWRRVRQLRCVACHRMGELGPSVSLGETAPRLSRVGAKLRTAWLGAVLADRRRIRSWQTLRMPHYDPEHVTPLIGSFAMACGLEPGNGPASPPATEGQRQRGIKMLGNDAVNGGLSCIACHDFGDYVGLGERGADLIGTTDRLRFDWFVRLLSHPGRLLPGTAMPAYFTSTTPRETTSSIRSLWAALGMGPDMPQLDRASALDPSAYSLQHYFYVYRSGYGSPKTDVTPVRIAGVSVSNDGQRVPFPWRAWSRVASTSFAPGASGPRMAVSWSHGWRPIVEPTSPVRPSITEPGSVP